MHYCDIWVACSGSRVGFCELSNDLVDFTKEFLIQFSDLERKIMSRILNFNGFYGSIQSILEIKQLIQELSNTNYPCEPSHESTKK